MNLPEERQGNTHTSLSCALSLLRCGVRKRTCTWVILEFIPNPSSQRRKGTQQLVQATDVATTSMWQVFTWPVAGLEALLCISPSHPAHSKGRKSIPISQMTKLRFIEAPGCTRVLRDTTGEGSRLTPNHDVLLPLGLFEELVRPSACHFLLLHEKQSRLLLLNATFS